ncbi:MAG: right-handed parallel beta-helix repeat-containing protein [Proteobacteria bacterium]|nr:right-handed parallel beta-helix repeat-containing protein [Pseudomonadota bacterium]
MRRRALVALSVLAACGDDAGRASGDARPPLPDAAPPVATCTAPPLVDVSAPTTVVGDGTPASCTEAALQAAATIGGTIVFACGAAPITIPITTAIVVAKDTVIDGGGTVALDGGGASRLLYLDSDYNTATPRLVVQRLSFRAGQSPAIGADTAQGGGAIYRDGGSLTVIGCAFEQNHATPTGQDVAGGAIYAFGGGDTIVVGSTFSGNAASDGGAIGSLNGALTIINSTFTNNAATGTGGNPGNGGAGGALYQDGRDEVTSLCGVTIANNTAGAIGGGVFRVSNDHTGSFAMDRSTVDHNRVIATGSGNAGGLYLEGLALALSNGTISRNEAHFNGGIWINTDTVQMTNMTIAENIAVGSNGGGLWLGHAPTGTLLNCTIANNHATADGQVAGAIFGDGLTLVNTIIANNTAMYRPTCDVTHAATTGNLQWPAGSLCSDAPLIADPLLGTLGAAGGDTEVMVPAAGSPAKGLGIGCPPTDQLGKARATPCTAGAVEAP